MRKTFLLRVCGPFGVAAMAVMMIVARPPAQGAAPARGQAPAQGAGQASARAGAAAGDQGFTDTPMLPGLPYHVHDPARPHPKVVTPGAQPGEAPSDAVVLFDGKDLSNWTSATLGVPGNLGASGYAVSSDPARWKVENGYMEIVPGKGAIATKERFGDMQLHVEWASPAPPQGTSQNRGNSGIFLMGLFETQILDSYNSPTYADGQAGAIYGQWPPLVNATRKPGDWQTYDIVFEAPKLDGDRVLEPAYVTVFLNGVVVHNRKEAIGATIYRAVPKYVAGPAEGPVVLQDHGHPVRYRNIWIRRLHGYDEPEGK
jgi:hypothetical protein